MSVSRTIIRSCQRATSIAPLQYAETVTADFDNNVSIEIPATEGSPPVAVENYQINWGVDRDLMQSIAIQVDGAVTIYTDAVSPGFQDVISLVANQCLIWTKQTDGQGYLVNCPFSGDVSVLYVTPVVGGVAVQLDIDCTVNNG